MDLTRTPLLLDEGVFDRAAMLAKSLARRGAKAYRVIKRLRTPEFVRHCVTRISQNQKKVDQIKRKGTVHGVCQATYEKNRDVLKHRHPKGSHHTARAYHRAADRLGESF